MTLGQRIGARAKAMGLSQSELARRVGVGQTTINGLIRGTARWSPYLPKIARVLQTTVDYLVGETDDPDAGAPLPIQPSPVQHLVTLQVALPSERALTRMFEGLLATIDLRLPRDEQAQLLAQRLPIGLSQLKDVRPDPPLPLAPTSTEGASPRAAAARRHPEPTR